MPGSFNEKNGEPNFAHQSAFNLFAVSSLIALCFSVTSLVLFLAILTSRHQEDDFHEDLPRKLLFGLTALFISIAAILVSFCAGHFFVLKDDILLRSSFPYTLIFCGLVLGRYHNVRILWLNKYVCICFVYSWDYG